MPEKEELTLRFDEGPKRFMRYSLENGISHVVENAIDIYLGKEDIGYITQDGAVTIDRTITSDTPSRMMRAATKLTLDQLGEIVARAREFKAKSANSAQEVGEPADRASGGLLHYPV